ncbi:hypothetical protein [Kribbella sp. VKM Ac-2569]|uniref:hypothetical protein n=1 Tax=Kribbella sp. VKM Ac-2569 TaxID=2512220 RepID=UPI001F5459C2|nr:hypothetical protein [Kribbella sp. VKM Ac-2569]
MSSSAIPASSTPARTPTATQITTTHQLSHSAISLSGPWNGTHSRPAAQSAIRGRKNPSTSPASGSPPNSTVLSVAEWPITV